MRRIAIIDVGSNTVKLVDFEYRPHTSYRLVDELRSPVRLSEGAGDGGPLRPEPFARGLSTLRTFASYCRAAGVDDVVAAATSAVRAAPNGPDFVAAVRDATGIELRVLDGGDEARLGTLAVANSFAVSDTLVLDLGGGSLQLSRLASRRFAAGRSWPLGAVRATETYLRGDPPKAKGLRALRAATRDALAPWLEAHAGGVASVVGMGGALRNLASADQSLRGYPVPLLHGYRLATEALSDLADRLAGERAAARAGRPGISRDRADVIVAGATVLAEALSAAGAREVVVSGQGLREGLLYPYLVPDGDHLLADVREFTVRNLMLQYHDTVAHNEHVRTLSLALFDALVPVHGLGPDDRALLAAAALVHDVGMAIDYYRHDHHGATLLLGRPLPGFDHREQAIVALLVRHHRKGAVGDGGLGALLRDGDMRRVGVLAGILRTAEYLDRGKAQRVRGVRVELDPGVVRIGAETTGDARVELEAARVRSELLGETLGLRVTVEDVPVATVVQPTLTGRLR